MEKTQCLQKQRFSDFSMLLLVRMFLYNNEVLMTPKAYLHLYIICIVGCKKVAAKVLPIKIFLLNICLEFEIQITVRIQIVK